MDGTAGAAAHSVAERALPDESPKGHKLLAVLGALGAASGPRRLGEVAAMTKLTKPTVHRLLAVLAAEGWATASEGGFYELGPRGRALAAAPRASEDPVDSLIQELATEVNQTVHVGLLTEAEVLYTHKASAPKNFLMRSRVGTTMPASSTALGKAMLARLDDREVRELVTARGLEPLTSATVGNVEALIAQLAHVRETGFAMDREENEDNVRCIAVAFQVGQGLGAVSISSIAFLTPEPELLSLVPRVRELARRIQIALT